MEKDKSTHYATAYMNYFRKNRAKILELKPGEEACPRCDGSGIEETEDIPYFVHCFCCKGKGKVDWIKYVRYQRDQKFFPA